MEEIETQPDEIYNLGAMSHVKVSFDTPEYVADTDGVGTLRILEAVRLLGMVEKTRILLDLPDYGIFFHLSSRILKLSLL